VVCRSVTIVSPVKTAESIDVTFGLWTLVGPRNHVLDGVHIPHAKNNFEGVAYKVPTKYRDCRQKWLNRSKIHLGRGLWRVQGGIITWGVHNGADWRPSVNRPCAAAIQAFCQITLITC